MILESFNLSIPEKNIFRHDKKIFFLYIGDPSTAPSQEILFWQFKTIESMFKRIAIAIEKNGCGTHPTDHLSFYCLGKREGPEDIEPVLSSLSAPAPATGAEKVYK